GRPPGDVEAGVLCARPCRHRRAGGRADARHDVGNAADRLFLPRWLFEVVVVRRLPARAGFSGAGRPLPTGSTATGQVCQPAHQAGPGRGGVRDHASRRGAAFGGRAVSLRIERVVTNGTFALDGGTWEVDNNIWLVGDDSDVVIIDAAHQAQPIVDAVAGRNVT